MSSSSIVSSPLANSPKRSTPLDIPPRSRQSPPSRSQRRGRLRSRGAGDLLQQALSDEPVASTPFRLQRCATYSTDPDDQSRSPKSALDAEPGRVGARPYAAALTSRPMVQSRGRPPWKEDRHLRPVPQDGHRSVRDVARSATLRTESNGAPPPVTTVPTDLRSALQIDGLAPCPQAMTTTTHLWLDSECTNVARRRTFSCAQSTHSRLRQGGVLPGHTRRLVHVSCQDDRTHLCWTAG